MSADADVVRRRLQISSMASTSASSVQKSFTYDVFLSFRGEDVRRTFVDHLYHALVNKGIITYKDDETIKKGEAISEQLIRSIQDSRFYIIVFSKNYTSSSWCLNELVEIMKCQEMTEHTACPIFFDVEPREVRHQSGAFGEAFAKLVAKHEKGSGMFSFFKLFTRKRKRTSDDVDLEKEDDVGRWRNALKQAADLVGMELKNTFNGHEAKFIQQIVEEVSRKLHFFNPIVDEKLVGMKTRVKDVVSSLEIGSDDTTLARAVFDHISIWFEAKCFVENVREGSEGSGLKELQKRVLQCGLNDTRIEVESVYDGKSRMKRMMCSKKILLVLDDVDHIDQLEALVGEPTWFKLGSRVIITTRNEQVLKAHQVKFINQLNFIHNVSLLFHKEAICLFSRYAFGREIPNQGYEELAKMVVRYANGLPLTIKVLGSHLCGRSKHEWVDAIKRLETIPLKETLDKLELSYIGLEIDQKEIFLDIACILKGATKKDAIRILKSCGFYAEIGLSVLEQKSLITRSKGVGEKLSMHDHLEQLGRNIVRRSHCDEPKRHSRLWIKKEIEDILVNESGTEETKCIRLEYTDLHPAIIEKGLKKMKELRLLYVEHVYSMDEVDEVSQYLPDSLQSLYWRGYPFSCLPKTFGPNKLVNLEMVNSKITELWEGGERKVLNMLKFLDLRNTKLRTFDLTMTPHLEELNLENCSDFVELQLPVECPKLKILNLSGSKVSNLNLGMTPNLERLELLGCYCLQKIHAPVGCLKKLVYVLLECYSCFRWLQIDKQHESTDLDSVATFRITAHCVTTCPLHPENNLPHFWFDCIYDEPGSSGSGNPEKLISSHLGLCACKNLNHLAAAFCGLQHLRQLTLRSSIPKNLWPLESLGIGHLPDCIFLLKHLKFLKLDRCLRIERLPESICGLECLEKLDIVQCPLLRDIPNNICKLKCLKGLHITGCRKVERLPEKLGCLECLEELDLTRCASLRNIPNSICKMKRLKGLHLTYCGQVTKLPEELGCLECLEVLDLTMCTSLRCIPNSISKMKCLKRLPLTGCRQLNKLPEELGCLKCVEDLDLTKCASLRDIPISICKMKCLKVFHLSYCPQVGNLPEELGCLERLEVLDLTKCTSLRHIPNSICKMKCLKHLRLTSCSKVNKLPDELGCLDCLETLDLTKCKSLGDIPNTIYKMKCLKFLYLAHCRQVEKLPEELGRLECLKELNIESSGISHLPQSIFQLKGLRVFGFPGQLQSYGFKARRYDANASSYYVEV
ncbi:putative TIR domain, P-loop containing nucleoside triphosphate hydrolase [Helianthus anomalus]